MEIGLQADTDLQKDVSACGFFQLPGASFPAPGRVFPGSRAQFFPVSRHVSLRLTLAAREKKWYIHLD